MSEKQPNDHRETETPVPSGEQLATQNNESHPRTPESANRHENMETEQNQNLEKIKLEVEKHALSGKEASGPSPQERQTDDYEIGSHQAIKSSSYQKSMQNIQSKHSPIGRGFSRFIHQPAVDALSEAGAKSIARPSALLGGGLCALIGSIILLIISKVYGFEYSYFVYIGLFGVGYLGGIIVEFARKLSRRKS